MRTLALDPIDWDLTVDSAGNIATFDDAEPTPLGLAQDAASAIRLFQGELFFNTTAGVPYFARILGRRPPVALLKEYFVAAALTVPGVASAVCFISSISGRGLKGQVQIKDSSGNTAAAAF